MNVSCAYILYEFEYTTVNIMFYLLLIFFFLLSVLLIVNILFSHICLLHIWLPC